MTDDNQADRAVKIFYKNWRGETAWRTIIPLTIWFGSTEWHKESQWLLKAKDLDKKTERDFALTDIQQWIQNSQTNSTSNTD